MTTGTRTPTTSEVIQRAIEAGLRGLHVALPASVQRYDATKQLVDVLPLLKSADVDSEGNDIAISVPVVTNVPMVFPGAGGFSVTFPVQVGDTVLLIFADRSLDQWLSRGGEVDPVFLHHHDITDAVAIPGLRDFAHALSDASGSNLRLGRNGGAQIHVKPDDTIALGEENPTDAVATANKVATELAAIRTWLNTHVHSGGTVSGFTGVPSVLAGASGSVASSVVKVKP